MFNRNSLKAIAAGFVCSLAVAAQASFVNTVTSYTTVSPAIGQPAGTVLNSPYGPSSPFIEIGLFATDSPNTYFGTSYNLYLAADQVISGYAALDYSFARTAPPGEKATVSIFENSVQLAEFDFTNPKWTAWSYSATGPGIYTLVYADIGVGTKDEWGLFTPIPEPSTFMAGALASLALVPLLRGFLGRTFPSR